MCHTPTIENEQIDRFVEYGMPQKVVKSVKYTIRKRNKANNEKNRRQEEGEEVAIATALAAPPPVASTKPVTEMITETISINEPATKSDNAITMSEPTTNTTITTATVNDLTNGLHKVLTSSSLPSFPSTSTSVSSCPYAALRNSSRAIKEQTKDTELKLLNLIKKEPNTETKMQQEIQTTKLKKTVQFLQNMSKFCGRYRPLLASLLQRETDKDAEQQQLTLPKACDDESAVTTTIVRSANTAELNTQQRRLSEMGPRTLEPSMDDVLAIGTQMTRKFAERIASDIGKLQSSKLYPILTRTTQPAHLIAVCILAFVLLTVGPDLMENHNNSNDNHDHITKATLTAKTATTGSIKAATVSTQNDRSENSLVTIAYLAAFATHFGSQIWMTFVSGLSLYFSLPRHTFGQCQKILFPKYFALNAMLSILMLVIYVKYFFTNWTSTAILQLVSLALTAIIEVTIRLYLAPPMLLLMHEKYKIEDAIGSGKEVGSLVQGDLVQCPHYQRIHKGFRRIHMTIAIGNMIIMLATFLHLYFLASKIRIS